MTPLITSLVAICALLSSCLKDKVTKTYSILTPIYESKQSVLKNIKGSPGQPIEQAGKIYVYGNYLLVNDVNKGVHIIDNTNPAAPLNKAFIKIPGNIDIAVKDNILYADIFSDFLAIDISSPTEPVLKKFISSVFPERQYSNGFIADEDRYIVTWLRKDTTIKYEENGGWPCRRCEMGIFTDASLSSSAIKAATVGVAGSMARFAVVNNYFYAVNMSSLQTFDVSQAADPKSKNTVGIGWNIETIYPFQNKLFIGSRAGMFVADISNPAEPKVEASIEHMRACDPVVTDGSYAFVTLRAGTPCEGTSNQLEVIDVQNLNQLKVVNTVPLAGPYGLAKQGNTLWICDGEAGLKIFDATNPINPTLQKTINNIVPFDVIALNGRLVVTAKEGIYQYSYSSPTQISQISKIPVSFR